MKNALAILSILAACGCGCIDPDVEQMIVKHNAALEAARTNQPATNATIGE